MNELSTINVEAEVGRVKDEVNVIQKILKSVMKEGTHYGKIPGCPKEVLYKPGAEKILSTFHLAPSFKTEDLSTPENIHYRTVASLTHIQTGKVMGEGVGECQSLESKYAWRSAICEEEFQDTPETRRRVKYYKDKNDGYKVKTVKQVRQDMYSIGNTILKMSAKRALIHAVINVTGCSDIFDQDIEEPHINEAVQTVNQESAKAGPVITEKQNKLFWAKIHEYGIGKEYADTICNHYGIESTKEIPASEFNQILENMSSAPKPAAEEQF